MNKPSGSNVKTSSGGLRLQWKAEAIFCRALLLVGLMGSLALAQEPPMNLADRVADRAKAEWMEGASSRALDILDRAIGEHPQASHLQKLRGDILATSRRSQEAVEAYDVVLQRSPEALDTRWAKWSVLLRTGQSEQALAELQHIAKQDADNPLVHMRLAQELRKLDRLEESLLSYQKAVELVSEMPGWRLALARARFDILDGPGARDEIQHVLKMVTPGSPEEAAARNLMGEVYGATKERGRRFEYIFSPGGTAAERKEWAFVRTAAWRLFEAHRFKEAEPLYRKALTLNPSDNRAHLELGVTLMELDRCEEGIPIIQKVFGMKGSDETYADAYFRVAQCLVALERWPEALAQYQVLYDAAVEFEETIKDVPVRGGMTILSKEKLAESIKMVRQHIPEAELKKLDESMRITRVDPSSLPAMNEEELYKKLAAEGIEPQDQISTRAALMGRDPDYSWYRFVISSSQVMRDDLPGGAHEFIPVDPDDTFPTTQEEIYLVFGLVTASSQEVPLTAKCYLETSKITKGQNALAQDHVVMAMNEQSGYFVIYPQDAGWTPGLYRCGLFVGDQISAYTHADEVRFRIIQPTQPS